MVATTESFKVARAPCVLFAQDLTFPKARLYDDDDKNNNSNNNNNNLYSHLKAIKYYTPA
jgi:hypothetical protein